MEENNEKIEYLFGKYIKSVDYDPLTAEEQNTLVNKLIDEQKKIAKQSSGSGLFDMLKRFFFGENNIKPSGKFILKPVLTAALVLISIGVTSVIFYKVLLDSDKQMNKPIITGTKNLMKIQKDSSNIHEIVSNTTSDTILLAEIKLNYSSHGFMDSKKSDSVSKPDFLKIAIESCSKTLSDYNLQFKHSKSHIITSWYYYENENGIGFISRLIFDIPGNHNLILSIWEEKAKISDNTEKPGKIDKRVFNKIISEIKVNYFNMVDKYE